MTGYTGSSGFPTTASVYQPAKVYDDDAFVLKIDPFQAGPVPSLLYSTFFGGSQYDRAYGIVADSPGYAHWPAGPNRSICPVPAMPLIRL